MLSNIDNPLPYIPQSYFVGSVVCCTERTIIIMCMYLLINIFMAMANNVLFCKGLLCLLVVKCHTVRSRGGARTVITRQQRICVVHNYYL